MSRDWQLMGPRFLWIVAFAAGACGGVEATPIGSELRVLHLSPDAATLEAQIDGVVPSGLGPIGFGQSSEYVALEETPESVALAARGAMLELDVATLDSDGARFTAVIVGRQANAQAVLFEDDDSGLAAESIRIRAIHAAPDVAQVDILNVARDGTVSELAGNLDLGQASSALDVPAGQYTIGIDLDDDQRSELYFELPDLEGGALANIYVARDESDAVVAFAQLGGSATSRVLAAEASLRVVHGSRDTGPANVAVDGGTAVSASFATSSEAITFAAGIHDISIDIPSSTEVVLDIDDISLLPGPHTVVIYGDRNGAAPSAIRADVIADPALPADSANINLQVFHAAPTIEEGDVYSLNAAGGADTNLVPDLAFGGFGTAPELLRAPYDIGFEANASGLIIANFSLPSLTVETANLFILQDVVGDVYILAQASGSNTALVCEEMSPPPCSLP